MEVEEEESWEMSRSDVVESISKLYGLLNITNHPLHYYLDWKTRHVLKSLLDDAAAAAQHNLQCFHSTTRFPNHVSRQKTLCTLHSHDKLSVSTTESIPNKQLVSDLSKLSDYPPPTIMKRCRLCNSKHPLNSANLVPSSSTHKVMQKTTQETPWFPSSSPYMRSAGLQQQQQTSFSSSSVAASEEFQNKQFPIHRIASRSECPLHSMAEVEMMPLTHRGETCQTFRKSVSEGAFLQVQSPTRKGVHKTLGSSQQVLNENVELRDTMGWKNLPQRPTVDQNTSAWPSEKHHYVHGLRVPHSMDDVASNSTITAAKVKTKNEMSSQVGDSLVHGPKANLQKDSNLYASSILLPETVPSTSKSHNKHTNTRTEIQPTLLHYDSSSSNKGEVRLGSTSRTPERLYIGSKHMVSQRQLKHSKEKWSSSASSPSYSPSSSFASYSWTSRQQTTTGFSSNSESFSGKSASPRECASTSSAQEQSNSNSSFTSSSYNSKVVDGQDGDSGSRRARYRSSSQRAVGRFRRFKNKLGLIFHHHHHHHHHHHKVDDGNTKQSTSRHPTRMSKHLHKTFQLDEKPELHAEKAAVKHGSAAIDRKQAHYFHELVQGLIHHIRRSKKSKKPEKSEAGIRRHGHKKDPGRILQQQGGVKITKRKQVKVGIKGKKPQLKAAEG